MDSSDKIGQILLNLGLARESDVKRALEIQQSEGNKRRLGEILTGFFLKEDDLLHALSMQQTGMYHESSIDILNQIMRHRLDQDDIRNILQALSPRAPRMFLDKVSDLLGKVGSFLDISHRLSDILSLDNILDSLISMVCEALQADRATLFLYDKNTCELFSRIAKGGRVDEIRFPSHLGIAGAVFTTGKTINIPDAYSDSRFNPEVDRKTGYRTKSILTAPVKTRTGETIGVIQVLNKADGEFTEDDGLLLESMTLQASAALQNAQLFEQVQRAGHEVARLMDVTTLISSELRLDELLFKIAQATTEILEADRSTLFMYDSKSHELWSLVAEGTGNKEIRFPSHLGIAGSVFTTGKTVNIPDAYADPRFNPEVDKKTGYRTKSILCMPIVNKKGLTIGVMQVLNKRGGPFTGVDENRLKAFAAQASIAIENAKLFNEVLRMKNYNESMLQSMSNGVITLDSDEVIVKTNAAALGILGLEEGDLAGMKAGAYFTGPNAWVADVIARVRASRRQDITMDEELIVAGGRHVSMNLTVTPLVDENSMPIGTMLMMEDITTEKRLKGTMARYMTKEVAEKLLESGQDALGGQAQLATVLFSDIRSFTTLSEDLGAGKTVAMLNEYFTLMVDIIFKYHGILDKYIGDAILSVFGAPFRGERDADNAVHAAIEMMRALGDFNAVRLDMGMKPINIGIGINTDEIISGNIGSPKRMDYTVIGDGVNLASRLEGANKYYGSNILISEFTAAQLKDKYCLREVDRIRVKGKNRPVAVFEVLDAHECRALPTYEQLMELYRKGLDSYRAAKWDDAIATFEELLAIYDRDKLSMLYIERCRLFKHEPPAEGWDGVWIMSEK